MVYNLSQEIHIENGYRSYESLNYENPADRSLAGELIDSFIGDISRQKSIKNIAIIGDDQVVPFFRRIDPTLNIDGDGRRWEEEYYDDMSGGGQNPTIVDSDRGMIMTDVPYGSYDNVDPDNIKQPRLDAAVGRVFADKPSQLIEIINAYCTPISLHNAAIFQLDADTVDWPVQVQVTLMPVLTKYFSSQGNIADSPNFAMDKVYLYDPTNCPSGWTATDVTTALQNVYLNMLWTHCNHMTASTYPKAGAGRYSAFHAGTPGGGTASCRPENRLHNDGRSGSAIKIQPDGGMAGKRGPAAGNGYGGARLWRGCGGG